MALDVEKVDVLVVGAGPAGLTAAATLRRYGVEVLVVERKRELSPDPRATVVSTRSIELLRSWGLEDEIRDGSAEPRVARTRNRHAGERRGAARL